MFPVVRQRFPDGESLFPDEERTFSGEVCIMLLRLQAFAP